MHCKACPTCLLHLPFVQCTVPLPPRYLIPSFKHSHSFVIPTPSSASEAPPSTFWSCCRCRHLTQLSVLYRACPIARKLHPSITFAALLLPQLKAHFPTARGSSGHRLFVSAFMLASKGSIGDDRHYSNKSRSSIVAQGMFQLREINRMEKEMCQYLERELNIDSATLEEFEEAMVHMDFAGPSLYLTGILPLTKKLTTPYSAILFAPTCGLIPSPSNEQRYSPPNVHYVAILPTFSLSPPHQRNTLHHSPPPLRHPPPQPALGAFRPRSYWLPHRQGTQSYQITFKHSLTNIPPPTKKSTPLPTAIPFAPSCGISPSPSNNQRYPSPPKAYYVPPLPSFGSPPETLSPAYSTLSSASANLRPHPPH